MLDQSLLNTVKQLYHNNFYLLFEYIGLNLFAPRHNEWTLAHNVNLEDLCLILEVVDSNTGYFVEHGLSTLLNSLK